MTQSKINIDNYEAYLLERFEGTIRAEDDLDLTVFLLENNLSDVSSQDLFYFDDATILSEKETNLIDFNYLKQSTPIEQYDTLLFETVEGTITTEDWSELKHTIEKNQILKRNYEAMMATKLAPDYSIIFKDKSSLKKVVVFRKMLYVLAAASFFGLFITLGMRMYTNSTETHEHLVDNQIKVNDNPHSASPGLVATDQESYSDSITPIGKNQEKMVDEFAYPDNNSSVGIDHKPYYASGNPDDTQENQSESKEQDSSTPFKDISTKVESLQRIASVRSAGVVSEQINYINIIKLKSPEYYATTNNDDYFGFKDKMERIDRGANAISGFIGNQANIVKNEGLFGFAREYDQSGNPDGFSLRIAGLEFSTAK
ncbi:MAG: hypothetical protein IT216_03870 [Saprospiraceae bacterium]|nr:MAG: hypothetical protein UZ08_BCD001000404 [Candidatus Parvibacillus calidus]MCC7148343.1 hypothetical protein [Saprospiraceae bacterium]